VDGVLAELSEGDVALVTDAGMPGISDPGSELVLAASSAGFKVEVVPGPSAVTSAVALSGFAGDGFTFLGFLPRQKKNRQFNLRAAFNSQVPQVIFEAPHRLRATLSDLDVVFGDRPMAVCRELTKLYEEVFRGTAAEGLDHFDSPRGEVVIVIQGRPATTSPLAETKSEDNQSDVEEELRQRLSQLKKEGVKAKEAVAAVVEISGLSKNQVYQAWVKLGSERS